MALDISDEIRNAFRRWKDEKSTRNAQHWFEKNFPRIEQIASNEYLRRYLFGPFNELLDSFGKTTEGQIKATITQVVMANAVGTVGTRIVLLWPHVALYLRGQINRAELASRLQAELGDAGKTLAARLALGAVFGPVYVWYLLARSVIELTPTVREDGSAVLRLEYVGNNPNGH